MKRVIDEKPLTDIVLTEKLAKCGIFAYKSRSTNPGGKYCVCVLQHLHADYAFTSINSEHIYGFSAITYNPGRLRYTASTPEESVRYAMQARDVYYFESLEDLYKAMGEKRL